MTPLTPEQEIDRAAQARFVLENALVQEVLARLETEIVEAWAGSKLEDERAREKAWMWFCTVRNFKRTFETYIQTGEMAAIQLAEKRKLSIFRSN